MDNLFSSSSPDHSDHEGGAVSNAGSAPILPSAANSGVASSANSGVDTVVGGNAASTSHSSSADNISSVISVPANEGAIASVGVSSTAPPLVVQSSTLGVPAAGHVVNNSARETNPAPVQSVTGGAVLTGFNFPNPFSVNAAIPPSVGVGSAQTSAMSAATPHSASSPISQPIVPALQLLSGVVGCPANAISGKRKKQCTLKTQASLEWLIYSYSSFSVKSTPAARDSCTARDRRLDHPSAQGNNCH